MRNILFLTILIILFSTNSHSAIILKQVLKDANDSRIGEVVVPGATQVYVRVKTDIGKKIIQYEGSPDVFTGTTSLPQFESDDCTGDPLVFNEIGLGFYTSEIIGVLPSELNDLNSNEALYLADTEDIRTNVSLQSQIEYDQGQFSCEPSEAGIVLEMVPLNIKIAELDFLRPFNIKIWTVNVN